ncbi:putative MFS multidrug transporter [Eremomyces bilateralis CBS 781.70]|uniref:MFS multidrug transporter n=1 Tax=Eremomyces bilateralis CBS 781.70 TaxID=1392243 RepID=A0A6G1FVC2_9PEZI|nr:putative MFS multidrug transporter [Eremomyces bilateralis CBS 781.70]KAF1809713.1 putative MFS multidrug transporter [Eremomyces bilateralis CBS 781.70]
MADTKTNDSQAVSEHTVDKLAGELRDLQENRTEENSSVEDRNGTGDVEKQIPVEGCETSESRDPNVIDWLGEGDPEHPQNWTWKRKGPIVVLVAFITFLTPLASSMFAPGIPDVMRAFGSQSSILGSFTVSIFILGYACGPLLIAPLSELYGRSPLYHCCNFGFVAFNVGCALSKNMGTLLALRFFAGVFGSCPLTIGAGTMADLIVQEKRGKFMAIWAMGPLLGPVIGPVAGGYLTQSIGWRWVFWVLAIAGGVSMVLSGIFLRESYPPVLLAQKVQKMRKETGNEQLRSALDDGRAPREVFMLSIIRPLRMLFLSPIVFIFSAYTAVIYGILYLLFTTISTTFENVYHFSQGSVGLAFLGIGVGSLIGLFFFGAASDLLLKRLAKGGVLKPEYRIPPLIPGAAFVPVGLFWYGWSIEKEIHWIMPIVGTGFVGVGMIAVMMTVSTYLVDAFTTHAASATAANTVFRSLGGAFLPLAGPPMFKALGLGWGSSLLGFVTLAMVPLTWFFFAYGERIRTSPRFQVKF